MWDFIIKTWFDKNMPSPRNPMGVNAPPKTPRPKNLVMPPAPKPREK